MSCVQRTEAAFPDHDPPCAGDNKMKSGSILGWIAGPIAFFLSCDRYTPHVSHTAADPSPRRSAGAEIGRTGRQ